MPERRLHARQRRPDAATRGWATPREYATRLGLPYSTVARWCQRGSVPDRKGAPVPVDGGDGRDYRIPLRAL